MEKLKNNLLVIGGTGFIGRHLIMSAINSGYNVSSISLNLPEEEFRIQGVNYYKGNIIDLSSIKFIKDINFEYVVNLGGYVDHTLLQNGGNNVINAHFNGLRNIINCLSKQNLKHFIQIGSSDEYGKGLAPQNEALRELPTSPYSLAKVASTHFLQMLYRTENFPSTIIRLFLTYGPGQKENRFLPQVIKGCINDKSFPTTDGNQIRDFCYIDDVIRAILLIFKSDRTIGEIINVGSGIPVSIKLIINMVCSEIGKGKPQFGKIIFRKEENSNLYADINKIKKLIKWQPQVSFEEGLKITINNIKNN